MIAMYHNVDESLKGCREKLELLEERWFFGNLLDNKSRMLRTRNYTSTNTNTNTSDDKENLHIGKSYEDIFESIKSMSGSPSLPPSAEKKELISSSSKPIRAPSTPLGTVKVEEVEEDEEEMEFSMGKLIRQASLNSLTKSMSPTSNHAPKLTSSGSNISRRKAEWDSRKLERMKPQRLMNQLKTQKSLSALECKQYLRVIPQFQEKKKITEEKDDDDDHGDDNEEKNTMKAQIKFWARAVASNVRQE